MKDEQVDEAKKQKKEAPVTQQKSTSRCSAGESGGPCKLPDCWICEYEGKAKKIPPSQVPPAWMAEQHKKRGHETRPRPSFVKPATAPPVRRETRESAHQRVQQKEVKKEDESAH